MIERWMVSVIVFGALITLGGTCLVQLSARLGWPRRWLWLALMALSLALPVALALRPHPAAAGLAAPTAPVARSTAIGDAAPIPGHGDASLLLVWAAASLLLAGAFAVSHHRLRVELAGCRRRRLFGASVCVSPDFGPAAAGLVRTVVVLPEWVFELPASEQQMVLRHELEHIRAGDRFVLLAGVTLAVLMPWNLGLWWQLRSLRVAMEVDCDARVAPTRRDRPRYAELLLRARNRRQVHRLALALVPASSALAQRLVALLDVRGPSPRRMTTWIAAALGCALVMTRVPVPGLAPVLPHAAPAAGSASPSTPSLIVNPPASAIPEFSTAFTNGAARSSLRHRAAVEPTISRLPATHPRYDSLIPYVQGNPTMARGSFGGVRGSGMARAVPPARADSGQQQPKE